MKYQIYGDENWIRFFTNQARLYKKKDDSVVNCFQRRCLMINNSHFSNVIEIKYVKQNQCSRKIIKSILITKNFKFPFHQENRHMDGSFLYKMYIKYNLLYLSSASSYLAFLPVYSTKSIIIVGKTFFYIIL